MVDLVCICSSSLTQELETITERADRLKTLYDAEITLRTTLEDKMLSQRQKLSYLEGVEEENIRLKAQVQALGETNTKHVQAIERLTAVEYEHTRTHGDSERLTQLVQLDKQHLQGEVARLGRLLADAEKRADDERVRAVNAEIALTKTSQQMLEMQSTMNKEFEDRRGREIAHLQ